MRAACAAALLLAACHAASPGTPDAYPDALIVLPDARTSGDPCAGEIALDDLGTCLDRAFCARLAECGFGDPGDTDCSDLASGISGSVTARTLAVAVRTSAAGNRVAYDPAAAPACLAAIAATPCRELNVNQLPIASCTMFAGRTIGTCGYPYECAPGTACAYISANYYVDSCGNDVCKPVAADGAPCQTTPCAAGGHCIYVQPSYVCASGQAGAQCNYDYDCATGLWCDYPGTSHIDGAGTCTQGFGAGHACTSDGQCGGVLSCVGRYLSPPAGTCVDTTVAGAACDGWCYGALLCAGAAPAQLGTCVPQPKVGDPCPPDIGCGYFMRCDDRGTPDPSDDVCAMRGELGATCTVGQCNQGDVCTADVNGRPTGTCVEPFPDGTGCYNADECASGACTSFVCAPFAACAPFSGGGGL
jgi:hypothetical protein